MKRETALIVKLGAIGDVVMSLPVADAIKKESPACRITWLIGSRAAALIEGHPSIDELLVIDENDFWKKRLFSLFKLLWTVRQRHFDRVYLLHWSTLFHVFFWLAGIPDRHGFARGGKSFGLTRSVPYGEGTGAPLQVNQYLSVVSGAYPQDNQVRLTPHLVLEPTLESSVLKTMRTRFPDRAWITMAPGGGNNPKAQMPERRWPVSSFSQLAQELIRETSYAILILGDRSESQLLDALGPDMAPHFLNLAGALTLKESAVLIKHSLLFIGNDSGLLHVAGAVGTPNLSFFGPTSPVDKVPVWTRYRVLYRSEPCSPCYKFGVAPPCPYHLKCLTQISPDQALAECKALLAAS